MYSKDFEEQSFFESSSSLLKPSSTIIKGCQFSSKYASPPYLSKGSRTGNPASALVLETVTRKINCAAAIVRHTLVRILFLVHVICYACKKSWQVNETAYSIQVDIQQQISIKIMINPSDLNWPSWNMLNPFQAHLIFLKIFYTSHIIESLHVHQRCYKPDYTDSDDLQPWLLNQPTSKRVCDNSNSVERSPFCNCFKGLKLLCFHPFLPSRSLALPSFLSFLCQ